jgi:molybdenum cofactor cytidylyltransferase
VTLPPPPSPREAAGGAVWAVVLAAGLGGRFGGEKLLAPWRGRPLLDHVLAFVDAAVAGGWLAGGVLVARAGDAAVAALADAVGLAVVPNPEPAAGVSGSVRRGLEAVAARDPAAGAALILLGDQPAVRADVAQALVAAWGRGAVAARPRYAEAPDEPGHPLVVDRTLWRLADELSGDAGLGPLLARRGVAVATVEAPGRNPDVDTAADLDRLRRIG